MKESTSSSSSSASDDVERARAIVLALSAGHASAEEVFAAFEELDALAPDAVRDALGVWIGPAPDPERLDDAIRSAHGFPARPLHLRTLAVVKDADVLDLGPVAEDQLRIAGRIWDGIDMAPEERLDDEVEGNFAGTLEHHVLANDDPDQRGSAPLFDVLLYADDAGVVFRAGTTQLVGTIAYGTVEMKDRVARVAIQEALASPMPTPAPQSATEPERIAVVDADEDDERETVAEVAAQESEKTDAEPLAIAPTTEEEETATEPELAAETAPKKKRAAASKKAASKKTAAKKTTAATKATAKKKTAATTTATAAPKKKAASAPKKRSTAKKRASASASAEENEKDDAD